VRSSDDSPSPYTERGTGGEVLFLLASLVAWYVHGLFDYFYEFTPTYVAFWLIAGLAVATAGTATPPGEEAA
jgi:hypothetical protein